MNCQNVLTHVKLGSKKQVKMLVFMSVTKHLLWFAT